MMSTITELNAEIERLRNEANNPDKEKGEKVKRAGRSKDNDDDDEN